MGSIVGKQRPAKRKAEAGLPQPLQRAVELHQQGKLDQAEYIYRAIAPSQTGHADALHLLGLLKHQQGRNAEALDCITSAVKAKSTNFFAWSSLGLVHSSLRQPEQALVHYNKALAINPNYADALNNRGNVLRDLGRPAQALASYDQALAINPNAIETLYNRGNALAELGRMEEALAGFERTLALKPDLVEALTNRGGALLELKRPQEALASCDQAIALRPGDPVAHDNRGSALRALGRAAEAVASYDKALASRSDFPEALSHRGDALRDLARAEEALASYDRAIAVRPHYAEALNNRGNALVDLERHVDALESYDRALAARPDYVDALANRAVVLKELRRHAEALESCDRALALRPDHIEALNSRANALADLKRTEDALACYDRLLAIDPHHAAAHDNRGIVLIELGRLEEASRSIEKAIDLAPRRVRAYYNLMECKKLSAGDPRLAAMAELAENMSSLADREQIELGFALGKAYAEIGWHDRSFRRLIEANAVKRKQTFYDEGASLAGFERIKAAFTDVLLRAQEGLGDPSCAPVFILGMPRSGTTLVEQTLASHPKLFGAGEIADFGKATVAALRRAQRSAQDFPEAISTMSGEGLRRLGEDYLGRIRAKAPAAERIANKTPENFRLVGLIHLALPNARIIHVRRDPVDTCVSCFSKLFVENLPYAYDLGELGRYFSAYEDLMAHWRAILPEGVMLDVRYEEVVADLEGQTRRILDHCGLEWDARCLDFHRTARSVRTASVAQVRQPIYASAVGRWRAYEAFLAPLIAALRGKAAET